MRTGEICSARCPLCHRGRFKDIFPAQGILERPEQNALSHRLEKKNWRASVALLTLRKQVDMDEVAHLSRYERERGYVQHICTCQWETRQYHAFWRNMIPGNTFFKSATTSWRTPSTGAAVAHPSRRRPAPLLWMRPTNCRKPPVRSSE